MLTDKVVSTTGNFIKMIGYSLKFVRGEDVLFYLIKESRVLTRFSLSRCQKVSVQISKS